MHAQTDRVKQIRGEASEHGLGDGIAFPMRSVGGWQAVVSLASEYRLDLGPGVAQTLHLASLYFHMRATELIAATRPAVPRLTGRQREILSWIAAGKTRWEISEILGVSQETIKKHTAVILERLDVATAIQAVIIALKSGQIQP